MIQPELRELQTDFRDFSDIERREREETQRLLQELYDELDSIGLADSKLIQDSLVLAFKLHENDRRTYEPYINHPLRVALYVIRLGIADENIVAAALLHDSIEDHLEDIEQMAPHAEISPDDRTPRALGRAALASLTNHDVASIVTEDSTPIVEAGQTKLAVYVDHVGALARTGPIDAFLIKCADAIDNARPPELDNGEEDPGKRAHVDNKLAKILPILLEALPRLEGLVVSENLDKLRNDLEQVRDAMHDRLRNAA